MHSLLDTPIGFRPHSAEPASKKTAHTGDRVEQASFQDAMKTAAASDTVRRTTIPSADPGTIPASKTDGSRTGAADPEDPAQTTDPEMTDDVAGTGAEPGPDQSVGQDALGEPVAAIPDRFSGPRATVPPHGDIRIPGNRPDPANRPHESGPISHVQPDGSRLTPTLAAAPGAADPRAAIATNGAAPDRRSHDAPGQPDDEAVLLATRGADTLGIASDQPAHAGDQPGQNTTAPGSIETPSETVFRGSAQVIPSSATGDTSRASSGVAAEETTAIPTGKTQHGSWRNESSGNFSSASPPGPSDSSMASPSNPPIRAEDGKGRQAETAGSRPAPALPDANASNAARRVEQAAQSGQGTAATGQKPEADGYAVSVQQSGERVAPRESQQIPPGPDRVQADPPRPGTTQGSRDGAATNASVQTANSAAETRASRPDPTATATSQVPAPRTETEPGDRASGQCTEYGRDRPANAYTTTDSDWINRLAARQSLGFAQPYAQADLSALAVSGLATSAAEAIDEGSAESRALSGLEARHGIDAPAQVSPNDARPALAESARVAQAMRGAAPQIAGTVQNTADGTLDVRLSPEELGMLRISFSQTDSGLQVTVHAERADTQELVRRHLDLLAQDLEALGFGSVDVGIGRGDPEGSEDGRGDGTSPSRGRATGPAAEPEINLTDGAGLSGTARLDLRL